MSLEDAADAQPPGVRPDGVAHPRALGRAAIGGMLAFDLLFRVLIIPAFTNVAGESWPGIGTWLAAGVVATVAWLGVMRMVTSQVERVLADFAAAPSPTTLIPALHALGRLARAFPLLWAAQIVSFYSALIMLGGGVPPSIDALFAFKGAMAMGPQPLAYAFCVWLTAPTRRRLALFAREHGIDTRGAAMPLRRQLALYSVLLVLAPSSYMASIAFSAQVQAMSLWALRIGVLAQFFAVAVFAVLCATFLSSAATGPIRAMTEVIRAIARQGDVSQVGRVAIEHNDEIGALAQWTNAMIDRLERTAAERAVFSTSLEALNHTLELRIAERTGELEQQMDARAKMEIELRQAQKLEAVGRLAAGIAHEINTPIQFVSDNVAFLERAFTSLAKIAEQLQSLCTAARETPALGEGVAQADALVKRTKLPYLLRESPRALEQSKDGLGRIATIVRAMKEFSHPSAGEMTPIDLHEAIRSTATIARNEWKYVAELEFELADDLPQVPCLRDELNQVILNLIVNAAHAIADVVAGTDTKGLITIRTSCGGECMTIAISDTGTGIPEDVRGRIFDPFFTTKEVGRGTGQGLAIARSVVVQKHGGELTFESELGRGTTFFIRLPLTPAATPATAA